MRTHKYTYSTSTRISIHIHSYRCISITTQHTHTTSELKFLWGLRCGREWVSGKPWAQAQCRFGIRLAMLWTQFAKTGDPSWGSVKWPSAYPGGGTALVVNASMEFQIVSRLRQSRCDFWDAYFLKGARSMTPNQ